jgi:NTP pyrophosphatase (non-canonical NTP hydrolase)
MNFNEYQALAMRTAKRFGHEATDLTHASLGLATESGEFITEVKRAAIYDKEITDEIRVHMAEELGDLLWYVALAAETLGISMHQMARDNIAKLQLRFPQSYSNEAAEARADKGGLDARQS